MTPLSNELAERIRRLLPPVTDPVLLDVAARYDRGEISFAEFKAQAAACIAGASAIDDDDDDTRA